MGLPTLSFKIYNTNTIRVYSFPAAQSVEFCNAKVMGSIPREKARTDKNVNVLLWIKRMPNA